MQGNAVVAALVELFHDFAAEEAKAQKRGKRQVVSPAALRRALHSWSEAKFHVGVPRPPSKTKSHINCSFFSSPRCFPSSQTRN